MAELTAFYLVWDLPRVKQIPTFFYKVEYGNLVMLLLYVDDLFITGMDGLIVDTKRKIATKF